ncbi:hypothetical protein [Streptomyces sp. NPDC001621]|uniref:hypothetical protein n=1 Tax=Streptomyces sp. NPDC001621 TaxID=3364594 RepID=UPI00369E2C4E
MLEFRGPGDGRLIPVGVIPVDTEVVYARCAVRGLSQDHGVRIRTQEENCFLAGGLRVAYVLEELRLGTEDAAGAVPMPKVVDFPVSVPSGPVWVDYALHE